MYSKNDYRYYLENRLIHSDDYLAHYGVKGMKWKQHVRNKFNENYSVYNMSGRHEYGGHTYDWKERGIESRKNPNKYLSVGSVNVDGKKSVDIYTGPSKKERDIKKGRVGIYTGSEGSHISIDTTKKKKSKKNKLSSLRKKYGLYRTTPKGKKLKGGGNVYVSHS